MVGSMEHAAFAREPKQARSRTSFDRALDAALALLIERRSGTFALTEVVERSGVSMGSIYGRVKSKEDLLRSVHAREMGRVEIETLEAFEATAEPTPVDLSAAVDRAIRSSSQVLRENAEVLRPFMALAAQDPVIGRRGGLGYEHMFGAFRTALLERREFIRHPELERSIRWSFTVSYSVLARWLGLGSEVEAAGEGDWDIMLGDLTQMVTAYLS